MYSGTSLTKISGRVMGAHQKFDRVARAHLEKITSDDVPFPKSARILHFEGNKGPDAIKLKSPSKDEPWHYFSPFDDDDSEIIELIQGHYDHLVAELKSGNEERSAFEAAWLAHAIVDGLTPAHHYPYEEKIEELWDDNKDVRTTKMKKLLPPGDTKRERLGKSWKYLGARGLLSTHLLFEMGVATILRPLALNEAIPSDERLEEARELGPTEIFKRSAREIAVLDMYTRYQKRGWSTKLIYDTRHKLCPTIVQTLALTWYLALVDAGLVTIES
jgi:hypothetical protein